MYSGYGITFDGKGEWSFDNDTTRNVVIFGADNSSSSHFDNLKNNFLELDEDDTFGTNENFGAAGKKFSINISKANTKFYLSLHHNADNSYLFVKADNKNVNFPTQFCFWSISKGFNATESREVSLNGNVYDFSVNHNFIDRSEILNIHKYLMIKNSLKWCWALLNKYLLYYWVLVAL